MSNFIPDNYLKRSDWAKISSGYFVVSDVLGYFWVSHNHFSLLAQTAMHFDNEQEACDVKRILDEEHLMKYADTCCKAYGENMRRYRAKVFKIVDGELVLTHPLVYPEPNTRRNSGLGSTGGK